jgi:hypothetical protein
MQFYLPEYCPAMRPFLAMYVDLNFLVCLNTFYNDDNSLCIKNIQSSVRISLKCYVCH